MRVLLSAYSCEPGQGSERGVGWNVAREVAKYHEVWVLTRPDESKEKIEAELADNPIPSLHFVYFSLPFWQDSLSLGQAGAMQLHYYFWQIQAYFIAKELHQEIGFDVVHHVTFVRYSCPSFLSFLPIPFVWGPVGGGESAPLTFWTDFHWENKLYETLRWLWRSLGEFDPFTRITAQRSKVIYATTSDTAQRIASMGVHEIKQLSALGMSQLEIEQLAQYHSPNDFPVRFINIARLLHWKGIHLGLQAFAQAKLPDAEYWILGEGPELERLHLAAIDLNIIHQVKFWGMLPREEALQKLGECTALVHPSLHDSGGGVLLEAMSEGKPVICLDLGGPSEIVTPETGIKVLACNPAQAVHDLAEAMIRLAGDRELCRQMGKAGQQRVSSTYSWEAKGKQFSQLYEAIANRI